MTNLTYKMLQSNTGVEIVINPDFPDEIFCSVAGYRRLAEMPPRPISYRIKKSGIEFDVVKILTPSGINQVKLIPKYIVEEWLRMDNPTALAKFQFAISHYPSPFIWKTVYRSFSHWKSKNIKKLVLDEEDIVKFYFSEECEIEIATDDEEGLWFLVDGVCKYLGLSDAALLFKHLDRREIRFCCIKVGQLDVRGARAISEDAFHFLASMSQYPLSYNFNNKLIKALAKHRSRHK
ncbi:hypothetical protein [Okeania sp. KiyG1]|uniref:hypothetical protein n=1 Tax=Okeania sp. KiyG1 TaxID=2720165 RepID=UPI0019220D53|nr:hypothetical protein [Okeania sp. KiyG1]GGA13904.1 hypothetical protein CYANOKiyG1_27410 [Okeania sp. KiyG1]